MEQTTDTRQEILELATQLIRQKSYHSFSYQDIADEVGIKKPSIHYHFPTKDILGVEAVRYFLDKIKTYITALEDHTDSPQKQLEAFFEYFRRGLERNYLCPGLALSVEFNTLNKEMQEVLRELFTFYITWLSSVLQRGWDSGIFTFKETPQEKAFFLASAAEGALIFSRAYQLPMYYESTVEQLIKTLNPKT